MPKCLLENMLRGTNRKGNSKTRPRFKGICAAAKELDCSRVHLWHVLTGRRQSKSLLARYRQLPKHT